MARKQTLINIASNLTGFVIQFGISFFLTPYLIKTLGKEAYSFYPLANDLIGYTTILTAALNSMAGRFITMKITENDFPEANKYFNSVLAGNVVIALILLIPSFLFVTFLQNILNIPQNIISSVRWLFALVLIAAIVNIVISVFNVAPFARNRMELVSIRNMQANLLRVSILIALFSFLSPSLVFIGIANLAIVPFLILVNFRNTKKILPEIEINKKWISVTAIKELVLSGIWNSINQLSRILLSSIDLLIANVMIGANATGLLAVVKTIPMFISQLIGVLVSSFVPEMFILHAKGDRGHLLYAIRRATKFISLIMIIPIGFLIVAGDVFFELWIPNNETSTFYLLSNLTLIPLIVTTSIEPIFHVYTMVNRLKLPSLVLLSSGIINTIIVVIVLKYFDGNVTTIPLIAMIIGILTHATFTPLFGAHVLNLKWSYFYKFIFWGIVSLVVVLVNGYILKLIIVPKTWISFIIFAIFTSLISIYLNILFILNKEEKGIVKSMILNIGHKLTK